MEHGAHAAKTWQLRWTSRAFSAETCCMAACRRSRRMTLRIKARSSWVTAASSSSADMPRRLLLRQCSRNETCLVLAILLLMAAAGCEHKSSVTGKAGRQAAQLAMFTRVSAPEQDRPGQLCSDFGESRICYEADIARRVPRSLPEGVQPTAGYRCGGSGRARSCEDRAANGGVFECGTTRCIQLSPRMPDDGEWECVEIGGLTFCHSRGAMAGVARGPRDLGWLCGPRLAAADGGEEICVDTAPDRPGDPQFRHCRYEQRLGATVRSCGPGRGAIIGDVCRGGGACPKDSTCQEGLCLPRRPAPACWLDADCGAGARCALGSCVSGGA